MAYVPDPHSAAQAIGMGRLLALRRIVLPQAMRVVREEIFGPVLVAMPFDDLDTAVQLANDTPYGLGASIWSNDLSAIHKLIPRIAAGTVWVNCHSLLDNALPFGGMKQSGFGRELGRAVIDQYTESKSVMMNYA